MAARLAEEHAAVLAELVRESEKLGAARRGAAASLGAAVEAELRRLAMPRARFEVNVGGDDLCVPGAEQDERGLRSLSGEDVAFLLAANPGEPVLPLTKVASGGELARAMLALRLVLLQGGALSGRRPQGGDVANEGPGTLVFDEVDAGIGGEAAVAVGRALAELAQRYQVIVVTHLAQVAAFAAAQVAVTKVERDGRSVALARVVEGQERVVELSRMLSGQPDSRSARLHAEELLMAAVTKDLNEVPKA